MTRPGLTAAALTLGDVSVDHTAMNTVDSSARAVPDRPSGTEDP